MSGFDNWLIDYTDNDDWCDRDITQDMEFAYNAGMERAAVIASNVKAPFSRFTIAAKIRNEIDK